jgi:hypothetical protein
MTTIKPGMNNLCKKLEDIITQRVQKAIGNVSFYNDDPEGMMMFRCL